jgi:hypothetical protein
VLLANNTLDIERSFQRLLQFSRWVGLDVNPEKSTYTFAQATQLAILQVPITRQGAPCLVGVAALGNGLSYKYMGVWVNLHLQWSDHAEYVCHKVVLYLNLIQNWRLTTNNCIYLANMVLNAYVAYGMSVVPFPSKWIDSVQGLILQALKTSMGVPSNMDDEPFFMPIAEGGRGLVHLQDLQTAVECACTLQEMTSISLSAHTTTATWHHAFTNNDTTIAQWVNALHTQGWQAWPRWRNLDWVGNYIQDPSLAHRLVAKGLY